MESFESIQNKLIRAISESSDREKISRLWKFWNDENSSFSVAEPTSVYNSEKPMTEKEIEDYFKEEEIQIPKEILEILRMSDKQIEEGKYHTNEEVEHYFEEWLKD